ncbi:MAG: BMP family ABC transporter substrate-binding protein [Cellvibrionaceae bacterium]
MKIKKFIRKSLSSASILLGLFITTTNICHATLKVAIVMPGPITDKSFNQAGYEGVKRAEKELGIEMAYSENIDYSDQPKALAEYARRGYDVVIGHGGEFQESVKRVAKRYEDTMFVIVNGTKARKNVATMGFDMISMGYIMGYVGGKISQTAKAGYIGAEKLKAYSDLGIGFERGFKRAQPNGKVMTDILSLIKVDYQFSLHR